MVEFMVNHGRHGHEGVGARRRAHQSRASCHSGARELASGGGKERGEHGVTLWASPELEQWCSDRAMAMKWRRWRSSATGHSSSGEGEKRRGRCGEKWLGSPPFIGVRGSAEEVATGGNGRLNGLQAIDGRGWLKRGLIRGFKARESYGVVAASRGAWPGRQGG
jgi:hypothetical protein